MVLQHTCACVERRSGRADIVHEHNPAAIELRFPKPSPPNHKSPLYVRSTAIGRELHLRASRSPPDQAVHDRPPEMPRNLPCLIEASAVLAAPVERHRHHAIGVFEQVASLSAHPFREQGCDRSTP